MNRNGAGFLNWGKRWDWLLVGAGLWLAGTWAVPMGSPGGPWGLRAAEAGSSKATEPGPKGAVGAPVEGGVLRLDGSAAELGVGGARLTPGGGKPKWPGAGREARGIKSTEGRAEVRRATEIVSQGGLAYDPLESRAVFSGSVQVTHPVFDLTCETLTAFLNRSKAGRGGEAADGVGAVASEPAGSPAGGKGFSAPSALDRAVAEGKVVITQEKKNEKGELERSVGRAQRVVYESATGNITLSGWPRVEQKQNLIVALEESTVMVLNKTGKVEVRGQSKTVLRDAKIEE